MKKLLFFVGMFFSLLLNFAHAQTLEEDILDESEFPYDEEINSESDYSGIVSMKKEFLDGDILKVSVLAADMISPVLGIAFNLSYESDNLAFLKYEPGNFLERGGDPFYLVSNDSEKEKIIFGETLRKDDNFPIGSGNIAEIYFQILNVADFNFKFSNGAISTLDPVLQDLDKILWEDVTSESSDTEETSSNEDFSNYGDANSSGVGSISTIQIYVISFSIIFSVFLILYLRNRQKKRPASSVNFK